MKEKEFLDELDTFPEWKVFGKEISEEIVRRMDEGELPDDYDSDEWYSLSVLKDVVGHVDIEDEMISFIAKLAKIKYEYISEERLKKDWVRTMEALAGKTTKQ